jgi:hypothetical protein
MGVGLAVYETRETREPAPKAARISSRSRIERSR